MSNGLQRRDTQNKNKQNPNIDSQSSEDTFLNSNVYNRHRSKHSM